MLRFLVDAQLPPQSARALIQEGHQAEHVEDVGLRHGKDAAIWEYATRSPAVIITKDEDFVNRYRRQAVGPRHCVGPDWQCRQRRVARLVPPQSARHRRAHSKRGPTH
ncbi:MAG: DUF5615 family PIN-like protein [Chthoniobacter sp.]|uniref:DUF5615 family PIN-like protein n=1 Tax=Chthoniobacter sp. TaxID=2510640 RepID=UPI0032AB5412